MAEGVMVLDTSCHIVLWNQAMRELTGWTESEVLGHGCEKVVLPSPREAKGAGQKHQDSACALLKVTDGQASILSARCDLKTRDGDLVPVLKNGRLLYRAGEAVAAVVTFTDLRPVDTLRQALAETRESLAKIRPPGRLVGNSAAMVEVYERIRLAAGSDATVLLLGETGTGKELAAEAIHQGSARREHPFVRVNCSALSESLLEAELFGHVRGAFTGAVHDKIGRFEAADGGTILLDEIGDLSPMIQLKLLRVLQEREFERVGESVTRRVNVRVVCATHRDLRQLVREGAFREDLFYRIHVFPMQLPPLRQRRTDIPLLADAFVQRFNRQTGKRIAGLDADVLRCLMDYCWPGNVRELENAIEHAFVTCRSEYIGLFDLPTELRTAELRDAYCREQKGSPHETVPAPPSPTESREELVTLLQRCNWNRSEAARRLGVDRTTVWRKMKRWGISPPEMA
jgi:PAS domain S-box-containing protein